MHQPGVIAHEQGGAVDDGGRAQDVALAHAVDAALARRFQRRGRRRPVAGTADRHEAPAVKARLGLQLLDQLTPAVGGPGLARLVGDGRERDDRPRARPGGQLRVDDGGGLGAGLVVEEDFGGQGRI
ncbi:hypothetical protein D3C86_1695760 [compost metagenome]